MLRGLEKRPSLLGPHLLLVVRVPLQHPLERKQLQGNPAQLLLKNRTRYSFWYCYLI